MTIVIIALLLFSTVSQAQFCDGFPYLTINSATSADIYRVETAPTVNLSFVCNTGLEINAMGIDPTNGQMIAWDDPNDRLVSVNNSCVVTEIPLVGAVNLTPRYLLGDVSQDGSTYIAWRRNIANILVVDLPTGTASELTIQGNPNMSDWAFGSDGLLYGVDLDNSFITTINPTTGEVLPTAFSAPGIVGGAVWFDQNDDFWIYEQTTGLLNQILIGSGAGGIITFGSGVTVSGADGAACAQSFVGAPKVGDIEVTKTVTGAAAPNPWDITISSMNCTLPVPYDTTPTITVPGAGGTNTFTGLSVAEGATTCEYDVAITGQAGYIDTTTDTLTGLTVSDGGTTSVEATCSEIVAPLVGNIEVTKTVSGSAAPNPWDITISSTNCTLPTPYDTTPTITVPGAGGTNTFTGLSVAEGATTCEYDVAITGQAGYIDTTTDTLTGLTVSDGGTTSVEATCSEVIGPLIGLGDYVWYDNNQDGIQGSVEPGVNGITVNLFDNATCTGASTETVISSNGGTPANDGYYFFTGLSAGSYCVEFMNLPANFIFTVANQGSDTSDSDADVATGQLQNINLTVTDPTIDAGIYANNGIVSSVLFCDDSPSNGSLDSGEEISGANVNLLRDFDCNGTGDSVLNSMTTDIMGGVVFNNLPVGLSPTPPNPEVCYVVNFSTSDPSLNGCTNPITPTSGTITVTTNDPIGDPITFGVNFPPDTVLVPVNNFWVLIILMIGVFIFVIRSKTVN